MMANNGISMAAFQRLSRKLDRLGKAGTRIAGKGVNKSLGVLQKAVKDEAPRGKTGNLKKAVGKRFKKASKKGVVQAKVGANVGVKKAKQKKLGNHIHLVILRTKDRRQKTTGRYTGRVRKINGFVQRGFKKAEGQAATVLVSTIKAELLKEVAKR